MINRKHGAIKTAHANLSVILGRQAAEDQFHFGFAERALVDQVTQPAVQLGSGNMAGGIKAFQYGALLF